MAPKCAPRARARRPANLAAPAKRRFAIIWPLRRVLAASFRREAGLIVAGRLAARQTSGPGGSLIDARRSWVLPARFAPMRRHS